jgi:uncharacterized LabA/DUF88 family protein
LILKKVLAYIDGFNLYFGMKSMNWQRYYWLDLNLMIESLLKPDQELTGVKYFTSRVTDNPKKQKRQNDYLEALELNSSIKIFFGKYQITTKECSNCKFINLYPNEKMTDVNIATELITDAYSDLFDVALLVSADSDLVSPVIKVRDLFKQKSVVICFPPNRHSKDLELAANKHFYIKEDSLSNSQLPDFIQKLDGYNLSRPTRWR